MKRYGNLYDKICDIDNLRLAFYKASKHKHNKNYVINVESDLENKLIEIQKMLQNGTYQTSVYKIKEIFEPKKRQIYVLPFFPDRIVHHAIMNVLEPIWENIMYEHSYACRIGKGQHRGSTKCMEFVRHYKYCLQCDISKFYPSINHEVLKSILRQKLKDEKLLNLLDSIIDSIDGETNIPIGNYISQWFGNLYLNELDTRAKQLYKSKAYIRYCDDFVFFADNKNELINIARDLDIWLKDKLKLKMSKCSLFPVTQGLDFLGYRHFPDRILLRKRTAKKERKAVLQLWNDVNNNRIHNWKNALSRIDSISGWSKHAQCYNFRRSLCINDLREIILNNITMKTQNAIA